MSVFAELGVSPALRRALQSLGYEAPTPVQAEAIPAALAGRDLLVSAETGSGKTLAYALPLLQHARPGAAFGPRRPQALVLVPTRELAAQVGEAVRQLARHLPAPLKLVMLYGGSRKAVNA